MDRWTDGEMDRVGWGKTPKKMHFFEHFFTCVASLPSAYMYGNILWTFLHACKYKAEFFIFRFKCLWGVISEMVGLEVTRLVPTHGQVAPGRGSRSPGVMGQDAPMMGQGGRYEYCPIEKFRVPMGA